MESVLENKNYELAYHLNPDIEEGELPARVAELEQLVTQNGGAVLRTVEPKRKHLSYPIHHKHYAYFGRLDFNAAPETLEKLNDQMKLQNAVLRYLLILKTQEEKNLRVLGGERPRPRLKTHEPSLTQPAAPEVKPEQMEKEIEDVLEKI